MYGLKKPQTVTGKAPEAYLYETAKKDKKVTDKDMFLMRDKKKKSK